MEDFLDDVSLQKYNLEYEERDSHRKLVKMKEDQDYKEELRKAELRKAELRNQEKIEDQGID